MRTYNSIFHTYSQIHYSIIFAYSIRYFSFHLYMFVLRGGYYHAMYGGDIVQKYRERYLQKFQKNPLFIRKLWNFVLEFICLHLCHFFLSFLLKVVLTFILFIQERLKRQKICVSKVNNVFFTFLFSISVFCQIVNFM